MSDESEQRQQPQTSSSDGGPSRVDGNFEFHSLTRKRETFIGFDQKTRAPYLRTPKAPWDEPTTRFPSVPARGARVLAPQVTINQIKVGGGPLILPTGLTVVTGPTAAGKSSFIKALARDGVAINRALAVEPHDDGDELADLAGSTFTNLDAALVALLGFSLREQAENGGRMLTLPVLDSLRAAVFETDGPAGDKGMIMPFFTKITRLNTALSLNGMSLVATVNPLMSDKQYEQAFVARLQSALACVITINSSSVTKASARFSGSVYSRPDRTPIGFTYEGPGLTRQPKTSALEVEMLDYTATAPSQYVATAAQKSNINAIQTQGI